jgi:hypothetical protein
VSELQRRREPDPIWETMAAIFGDPTPAMTKLYGRVVRDLRAVGATPQTIAEAATGICSEWGRKALTPTSLAKWHNRYQSQLAGLSNDPEEAAMQIRIAELERSLQDGRKLNRGAE